MSNDLAPIEVFCSYAHEDKSHLQKLHTHLSMLKREGLLATWHDRQIVPGTDWAEAIDTHLEQATVILPLISPDFLASDYCYQVEMQRAMQRHEANEARVLPIIVRPCDWTHAPFAQLQCLPHDGKPITTWENRDTAWNNVVEGIRAALDDIHHLTHSITPSSLPRIWMIPFARNRFFTGQAAILARLADTLNSNRATALSQSQAISGLGGIGKTQIAIEYAYQQQEKYQAVFWVRSDTHEALVSGYVTLADALKLPEKDERDQTIIIQAVLRWLTAHTDWLLIIDNADDLSLVLPFLPSAHTGHILLTTRALAVGSIADPLVVDALSQDEGALLLLRRARLIEQNTSLEAALPADVAIAREISEELGGLPLALDQAGAYIEETGCGLAGYQQAYQQSHMELLKRRGHFSNDNYPFSVATTWTLSFEKGKQQSPAAADLLYCCALLHPDAIPEELFTSGAIHLGSRLRRVARDTLAFNDAVRVLLAYSLIRRDSTTTTLSIHRLVQAVLIDAMPPKLRKQWKEHAVRALNEAFPEVEFKVWTRCERLLSHVLVSVTWIEQGRIFTPEAAHLLDKAGTYLRERGQYLEAELFLTRALSIREQYLGADDSETAQSLRNLATLYWWMGKYEQAEPLHQRALSISEQHLGPDTAGYLNNLAILYGQQGKYELAEPLFQRALSIREQHLGANHPATARSLNNLAELYRHEGRYELAEPLYQRALSISERHLGIEHPDTAHPLHGLAEYYREQGRYELAEPLYQRALSISEQHLGVDHPLTAGALYGLAQLSQHQDKYEQAEAFYQRALTIREQRLGPTHPLTLETRKAYTAFLRLVGRDAEATALEKSDEGPTGGED